MPSMRAGSMSIWGWMMHSHWVALRLWICLGYCLLLNVGCLFGVGLGWAVAGDGAVVCEESMYDGLRSSWVWLGIGRLHSMYGVWCMFMYGYWVLRV
ncbi:uncharacterized protein BO80DRAFT_116311 [Aspergillus ibericus CBS 121593]|uniref:Transmembrane protein n=1 Tax=Aspergillus ibericus CBS 121593 TaxID=1448316 RepID=A0A395GW88_9EURO|nr:hypothetical protein BO80DRAFT_116311 [Aspergillus ibericus CBS 121593]RAK99806.1 hypothetical protein BO80DRAFT_116311 [Aspergillus ibericus CBS 121593]